MFLPLSRSVKAKAKADFQEWLRKRHGQMKEGSLSLAMDEPILQFEDKTRELTVSFNPELMALSEEANYMTMTGFTLPDDMVDLVKRASRLLNLAKELTEITRFHNTVGETMIKSQRPMMLEGAMALTKEVKTSQNVTWSNPESIRGYLDKLHELVDFISKQNEFLSGCHKRVMSKVQDLYQADLIRSHKKWKDTIREIQEAVQTVEDAGFTNVKGWRDHIDSQIYKVLDSKYRLTLVTFRKNLPPIRVEVICFDNFVQFRPPLEELRQTYRGNIRKLSSIPSMFEGISHDSSFFTPIEQSDFAIRVQKRILLYENELFERLEKTQKKFSKFLLRGRIDFEALQSSGLPSPDAWEGQFRFAKQHSQDVAILNFNESLIGCFTVSYIGIRLAIQQQSREYWEILARSLMRSASDDLAEVKTFLKMATDTLNEDPMSLEDVTASSIAKEKISEQMKNMRELVGRLERKNQVLLYWTKTAFDLAELKNSWSDFEDQLGNHQQIISRQMENIKINLKSDAEAVLVEMNNFKLKWDQLKPKNSEIMKHPEKLDKAIEYINEMQLKWYELTTKKDGIITSSSSLGLDTFDFSCAAEIEEDLAKYEQIWGKLSIFRKDLKKFEEEEWIIFRSKPYLFEEFLEEWDTKLRNGPKSEFTAEMIKDIEEYRSLTANIKFIRGDIFTEKHWAEIFSTLAMPQKSLADLTAGDFFAVRSTMIDHIKELKEINSRATGEITVRQALTELDTWEIDAKFQLAEHKNSMDQNVNVIQDFKSVTNKLGDNQSLLQSIRTSPFYSHFADRISIWETKLSDLDEYVQQLSKIQRRWIYLEPVFSHGVLEAEQARFRRINEEFLRIMQEISKDSRILSLCKQSGIRGRLNTLTDQLSRCQNSLNEFLEKKRSGFPRFYFLGDDDLLEILGQSTKPMVIQSHLKKLFAGIHNVDFDDGFKCITAMKSLEGEVVLLKTPVKITSRVEEWLTELSNQMRLTLKSLLLECISDSRQGSNNPQKYPSQALCLSNVIIFTDSCEEAIRSGKLSTLLKTLREDLDRYTHQRISQAVESNKVLELKLKDLILDVIHQIEVVEYLMANSVRSVTDWHWHKQLRFNIRENGDAVIRMADAEFKYSYEYQGNAPKLVHTPLTDKCYLTLTQGMRMGLGGNPYGPAGTGKTESVKALGGILGRQVLVFNCDEGIDVKAMGRIFTGLVKCGAWGCFDEFNRLDGLTLSAVSLQIQPIQMALKQGAKTVRLMDEEVPLDPNSGIFVTLNPAGQGYGGRNKLPDNIKQLFRPVVMSQPDNERIAEVILYTEGFKYASPIGKKLVEIFSMSQRLLTPQKHYDWGLRALKTVLKGCGSALAEQKKEASNAVSEEEEINIVVATLRLNTLPKLTYSDCLRFDNLIKDVFYNVNFKPLGHGELAEHVKAVYQELQLVENENQVKKCLELYEQLQQRMGVVIVGPPCCGKSTVLTVLRHALLRMGRQVKAHVMNPKAMPRVQLLGHINLDTRQWTDGVLTMKAQQVYTEPPEVTSWIICDGDIDPEWVESLNSVLDDNRLLTLPSGWRIKFGPNVNFIFETHDLSLASPATVSRMGMIFMSEEDADVKYIVTSWLSQRPQKDQGILASLIDEFFFKGLSMVKDIVDPVIPLPLVSVAQNTLSLMADVKDPVHMAHTLIRGLGGHLYPKQQEQLATDIIAGFQLPGLAVSGAVAINSFFSPVTKRLESYTNDSLEKQNSFSPENIPLVHTIDVKRALDYIRPWIESRESFMLIGPEGCGKTMVLDYAFRELPSTDVATFYCSGLISPENVLQKLSQICVTMSTNTGRVYKSKDSERLILYFKDINLVKPDKWGTCQLVEFLRQIIVCGGFFDKNLEWVTVRGIQVVASITANQSVGRYDLSPRFTSRIHTCTMSECNAEQLFAICHNYLSVLSGIYWTEIPAKPKEIEELATGMVRVYTEVRKTFTPVNQSHYVFTPRDLVKWIMGLLRYNFKSEGKNGLFNSWSFECCRIFRDKLVSEEEKRRFTEAILLPVAGKWGIISVDEIVNDSWWVSGHAYSMLQPCKVVVSPLFGTELVKATTKEVETVVEKGMAIFGRENRNLNIVLIRELLDSVTRFDRILTFPTSSLLLAGRAGVGRRSALSIVSVLHRASVFTLKVGKNYTLKSFKTDLKNAIHISAVEGNKVFLVIEDFQLVDVIFLDMINSLLSSGEIPGLYSGEELENIVTLLRDTASSDGYTSNIYNYFAQRVRNNLHLILIMDSTSKNFVQNCQSNPALYKKCHMLWLDHWGVETMTDLPLKIMTRLCTKPDTAEEQLECFYGFKSKFVDDSAKERFSTGFLNIFRSVDKSLQCPRRYTTFLFNYAYLYRTRRKELVLDGKKLEAGISKLTEATDVVKKLKSEAVEQEKILAEKQGEGNKAMEMISVTLKSSNVQKGELEELRKKTEQEKGVLAQKKSAIDAELAEIEPLVRMAQQAVGSIKNEALSEIRSLRAPPDVIRDILEGVLRVMGIRDMSWNSMKTFLSKRGIKDEIRNFDARNIDVTDREAVEKMLKVKQTSFDPKNAKRASTAAAPLAEWVIANVKYGKVLEKIDPLERYKEALEENLKMTETDMEQISSGLTTVDEKVKALTERYKQCSSEAVGIQFNLDKAKATLAAAEGLVGKLNDEYTRWKMDLEALEGKFQELPFEMLLTSAFISYLSNAPEDIRTKFSLLWSEMLGFQGFDFCKILAKERSFHTWQSFGLPADRLSRENAIMIIHTCLRPYVLDPSDRAISWLVKQISSEKQGQVTVVSLHDSKFASELELAIRFGKSLIILEADVIEPILIPVLRGDLISNGSREVIPVGEKMIDYNPSFKLYLTTRNPSPVIPPDAEAVLTVINFTTTRAGLTSQLLVTTIGNEHPDLKSRHEELVTTIESLKSEMEEVGSTLLRELANAEGNILENKELLASLNETKASALKVAENLREASKLEEQMNKEIDVYRPFAEFGSRMYFAVANISLLNPMYQFSLTSFVRLFETTLKERNASSNVQQRIVTLKSQLFDNVYEYVCKALYKADRMAFALHFAWNMFPSKFNQKEWEAFTGQLIVGGSGGSGDSGQNLPNWIPEDRRFPVQLVVSAFPEFYGKLDLHNQDLWMDFNNNNDCEEVIPRSIKEKLSPFQEVLLINILRPDRLLTAMYNFARATFGRKSLYPAPPGLTEVLSVSNSIEPILLLISSGSDPSQEIREVAETSVGLGNYVEISLGQGSINEAFERLQSAANVGQWVCIKNLHLVTHLLDSLEKEVRQLNPHEKFRLWLTSEPHLGFPKILAQCCLKIAYEAPQGVKKNIQRTYSAWTHEYFTGSKNTVRCQALFVLATFHAIIQERRNYIPQGWSTFYEFNDGDLRAGADVIEQLFRGPRKEIQWNYIHGLFENAIYGGRIDNEYDTRVLFTYLQEFFSDQIITGGNPSQKIFGPFVKLPSSTNINDYYSVIEGIPENDRPSFFGLPSNVEKSWQKNTSTQIINQLKTLSRGFNDATEFDKQRWSKELSPIMLLWKNLTMGTSIHSMFQKTLTPPGLTEKDMAANPVDAFVLLEHYNVFVLVQKVHRSLGFLSRVIRGISVPTEELFDIAQCLMVHEVPMAWKKLWDGPTDASQYVTDLAEKAAKVHEQWRPRSKDGSLLKQSIRLSDLINPDTFFSAFKQYCARKRGVSMSEVELACSWERNSAVSSDKLYCSLKDIMLEGCGFKGGKLQDSRAEDPPAVETPECFITWKSISDNSKDGAISSRSLVLAVPLYVNEARKKLIGSLDIPFSGDKAKWIKTGIALFLK